MKGLKLKELGGGGRVRAGEAREGIERKKWSGGRREMGGGGGKGGWIG